MENNKTKILAIETSAPRSSIALLEEGVSDRRLLSAIDIGQSDDLAGSLAQLLDHCLVKREEIGLIAVSKGPGSLTGIRNGRAFAKGLSDALRIAQIEIYLLDALTALERGWERYFVAVYAGRQEIHLRRYDGQKRKTTLPRRDGPSTQIYNFRGFKEILRSFSDSGDGIIVTADLFDRPEFTAEMEILREGKKLHSNKEPLAAYIGSYIDVEKNGPSQSRNRTE